MLVFFCDDQRGLNSFSSLRHIVMIQIWKSKCSIFFFLKWTSDLLCCTRILTLLKGHLKVLQHAPPPQPHEKKTASQHVQYKSVILLFYVCYVALKIKIGLTHQQRGITQLQQTCSLAYFFFAWQSAETRFWVVFFFLVPLVFLFFT